MPIRYVEGDILADNMDKTKKVIVCHQVNCQGVMGAGLALQIRRRFPKVFTEYQKKCALIPEVSDGLGDVQFVDCIDEAGYTVANVFGQSRYGRDRRYTDYDALETALRTIGGAYPDGIIRIPYRMGCGLAGGDWTIVLDIVNRTLVHLGLDVEIYSFNK